MKILLISGSLRKNSFNTQLAVMAKSALEPENEAVFLNWQNVPFFSQDLEADLPQSVIDCRKQILDADGLWFFTPEYNGQIPGGLKNLLDWMSRSIDAADPFKSVLRQKPAAISGAGGRRKTAGSRENLTLLLGFCGMKVFPEQVGIALTAQEMKEDAFSNTEEIEKEIKKQAQDFVAWIKEQKIE